MHASIVHMTSLKTTYIQLLPALREDRLLSLRAVPRHWILNQADLLFQSPVSQIQILHYLIGKHLAGIYR